uniref:Elongator complex protein 5 n=1 Tax=Heliothis virescens TaxID=7102 RepID=A0A2A4J3S3_HELVI
MTLLRLKSAPFVLIEDDVNKNINPLLLELVQEEKSINIICYEQPIKIWRNVFRRFSHVNYYEEFDTAKYNSYVSGKCSIIIDSINQMALCMGWNECLKYLKRLQNDSNVNRLILVLHKDCIPHSSKLLTHLNHMVNVVISYDTNDPHKVWIKLKKGSKVLRSEDIMAYDSKASLLTLTPVVKQEIKEEEPEKPLPTNLTTFKIEVDQNEKIQKYNLKLPYMSKIHEGESKVYYEPDAVDDWDEEDPDEDLDI